LSGPILFIELATLCEHLVRTTSRKKKTRLISDFLLKLEGREVAPSVLLIIGQIFPESEKKALKIGFATISKVIKSIKQSVLLKEPLTILRVHEFLKRIMAAAGPKSRQRKESLLESLLSQARPMEAKWILKSIFGEMQHGVSEGLMLEAIAGASTVDTELLRRAYALTGNIGRVAEMALSGEEGDLSKIGIQLFRPFKPMLAETSYDLGEVLKEHNGVTALEYKFDGARVQIHKKEGRVRVFSRRLSDVTDSLPEVVELIKKEVRAKEAVVEGEVVAVGKNGRPLPFQDLMRRFKRMHLVEEFAEEIPLKLYLFDILYLDGKSLIEAPYRERREMLSGVCDDVYLAKRMVTKNIREAEGFLKEALREGHEGVLAKDLESTYTPGRRRKMWFKIKPMEFLDLVILAADWGYGRRTGWLSDYYLAALNEETGEYLIVGKTFKGLTDEEFKEMTHRLLDLKVSQTEHTVYVKPKVVVEVAFNEVQRSPRYKSGLALRFARITRMRDDKAPEDVDTIERVRRTYDSQFLHKSRLRELRRIAV